MERQEDDAIDRALGHLHEAQRELSKAEDQEERAERALIDATEELERARRDQGGADHGGRRDHEVTVRVKHLGEHERVSFDFDQRHSLQALWDRSYLELEVERGQRDVLQAPHGPNPVSLMPHLGLTLEHARAQNLCDLAFEIAAATGGA
jgi:hypothetical protein